MRLDEDDARARFARSRVARLATVSGSGEPHIVPVTFAVERDTVVIGIDHKPKRTRDLRRLRNIADNPRVSLAVDEYSEDWRDLWWVRADGTAVVRDASSVAARLTEKYPQYLRQPPDGPFIVIDVHRWVGWSAS